MSSEFTNSHMAEKYAERTFRRDEFGPFGRRKGSYRPFILVVR